MPKLKKKISSTSDIHSKDNKKPDNSPPLIKFDNYSDLTISLLEYIEECVCVFSLNHSLLFANSASITYSGYSENEMFGRHFNNLFVFDQNTSPKNLFSRIVKEKSIIVKGNFIRKDHQFVSVKIYFKYLKNQQSDAVLCIFNDSSGHRQIEDALRESERKLSTLISNLQGMVYRCRNDQNWTMEFVSDGCQKLLGYTVEEITNHGFIYRDLVHHEDRDYIWQEVQKSLAKKQAFQFVFRVKTKSGEHKWILEQGVGVFSSTGDLKGLEGFIMDVTEQKKLENKLYRENKRLRSEFSRSAFNLGNIIGQSDAMQQVYRQITEASSSNSSVVIYGESGTGKELVARAIHDLSDRESQNFVAVNCGAIPETLIESEFFGYKKGAFSGADYDKLGSLDIADKGTLFLDEIGEIKANMQIKLLRAIEGNGYTPVGGNKTRYPNLRIISATNRNLLQSINDGKFRKDFFYRIHVIPIELPPLRNRIEDIPLLVTHFIKMYSKNEKRDQLPLNVVGQLQEYDWPGNVRELQNFIQRYITTRKIDFLEPSAKTIELSANQLNQSDDIDLVKNLKTTMDIYEKRVLETTLKKYNWHRGKTAKELGIDYRTLQRKMKKFMTEQT